MRILDVSAGNRAIWFDKRNPLATFLDIRSEVLPDVVADSGATGLPDNSYDLAVFDPPHVNFGKNAQMSQTYGYHTTEDIRSTISRTSKELSRVLRSDGLLAFKWNDHDQRLETVLHLMQEFEPLFGHRVSIRTKHASTTFWCLLRNRKMLQNTPAR